jgi:hypothetical protein
MFLGAEDAECTMNYKEYFTVVADDCEHKDFYADINYRERYICTITQEEGFDKLEIEIHNGTDQEHLTLELDDFWEIIELCKKRLWDLRKDA